MGIFGGWAEDLYITWPDGEEWGTPLNNLVSESQWDQISVDLYEHANDAWAAQQDDLYDRWRDDQMEKRSG